MKVFFSVPRPHTFKNAVVALGVFDGVHRGHRRVLGAAVEKARQTKGTSLVVTFHPHPQKQDSLYSLAHRLRLIAELGVDACVVMAFDRKFSRTPAELFVKNFLVGRLNARYVYVGENFRFGYLARGDFGLLEKMSAVYGFRAKCFKVVRIARQPVSSTQIRRLIATGQLNKAKTLLCRPVSVYGDVVRGNAFGKKLGFPTANINPHHEVLPPSGVYAVEVLFRERKLEGLCFIGPIPKFVRVKRIRRSAGNIEVHILNFRQNIYGQHLEVQFLRKIRPVKKFSCPRDLVAQIKKDIKHARRIFSSR
ncbi:MAG TPA: riboflavin biosynthesis protein RibF [Patescibacteria group bacterium]|nr:riboflavin biosynthesis protein RibF [Patescibacteria group bacterium]